MGALFAAPTSLISMLTTVLITAFFIVGPFLVGFHSGSL